MPMSIHEMIAVLRAASEGKTIQVRGRYPSLTTWCDVAQPVWDFQSRDYRAKPAAPHAVYVLKEDTHPRENAVWAATLITPEQWKRLTPEDQAKWTRFVQADL